MAEASNSSSHSAAPQKLRGGRSTTRSRTVPSGSPEFVAWLRADDGMFSVLNTSVQAKPSDQAKPDSKQNRAPSGRRPPLILPACIANRPVCQPSDSDPLRRSPSKRRRTGRRLTCFAVFARTCLDLPRPARIWNSLQSPRSRQILSRESSPFVQAALEIEQAAHIIWSIQRIEPKDRSMGSSRRPHGLW